MISQLDQQIAATGAELDSAREDYLSHSPIEENKKAVPCTLVSLEAGQESEKTEKWAM